MHSGIAIAIVIQLQKLERDEKRFQNNDPLQNRKGRPSTPPCTNSGKLTRSTAEHFNRQACFFCQGGDTTKQDEIKHACQSVNSGRSIKEIVEKSDNDLWKLQLADVIVEDDLLARDIVYHNSCKFKAWQKHVNWPKKCTTDKNVDNTRLFIAEIEFFDNLQEKIASGEYITTIQAENLYKEILEEHGINTTITRRALIAQISENVPNIVISQHRGNLPCVLHSKQAGREALDLATDERDIRADLNTIFKCAKIIRRIVSNVKHEKSWTFTGSLDGSSECGVPVELLTMNKWILQGRKMATTKSREKALHKSSVIISQTMIQEFKTTRQVAHAAKSESSLSSFRRRLESPYAVGLSLWMYHNLRSQKAVTLLSNANIGISYSRVTQVCSQIAHAVQKNILTHGVFVPHGLVKGLPIRASADNVDKKVDTYDGKNSFHAMAISVYQPESDDETLVEPLDLSKVSLGLQIDHDVPSTCIQLVKCNITGSPKPRISPSYMSYKVGVHKDCFVGSLNDDIAWMMARYLKRPLHNISPTHSDVVHQLTDVSDDIATIPDLDETIPEDVDEIQVLLNSSCDMTSDMPDACTAAAEASNEYLVTTDQYGDQQVPVWSAYNSILNKPPTFIQDTSTGIDKVYTLPIINAPAHEWSTLVTTLDQLYKLNVLVSGSERTLVVTFDMDLYKRVLKLEYLDSQYKNKWVVCPGAFHTSLCAIRCLGKTIEGSGIDEAWVEADMYSSVTVNQIINGSHYSRSLEAHEVTLQVLFDLWIEEFFAERPAARRALEGSVELLATACASKQGVQGAHMAFLATMESLELIRQLAEFDARHSEYPMFKWARMYMRQVMTLLQFQRATRQGDWFLHLSSLEKLCVYFFAYDRLSYAQHIPEYVARMYQLQSTDPEIWLEFVSQDFTVNTSNQIPFTRLGMDLAQEHSNKKLKGQGAISGITQSSATLLKFCMCAPELARIANETENMVGMQNLVRTEHHCLNQSTVKRQERTIANLLKVLAPCRIFSSKETHMFNITTKEIIPKPTQESILSVETRGLASMEKFVEERICGDKNLWDKMSKCKTLPWNSAARKIKLQAKDSVLTLRATSGLMSRLLVVARSSREVDLEEVIGKYEFSTINRTLMKPDGRIHPTVDKSKIITVLENLPAKLSDNSSSEPPLEEHGHHTDTGQMCLIVDGMAVVQELMAVKQFENCKALSDAYVSLIDAKARKYHVVRVVFDNYSIEGSLKEATRERRRGGKKVPVRTYKAEDTTKIRDAKAFLGSNATKDSLTLYLAQKLVDNAQTHVITATHSNVLSNKTGTINPGVSSQEEADTLMIFHATEAAKSGFTVHIYSQDTDVLVLAIRRVPILGKGAAQLMGTSDRRRLVMLEPIYNALGPDKAEALCKLHALTGCDTTGHINGKSKKSCLEAYLKAGPEIVAAISSLGIGTEPSEDVIMSCVSFLCSICCRKGVHITEPRNLRWKLFKQQGTDKELIFYHQH